MVIQEFVGIFAPAKQVAVNIQFCNDLPSLEDLLNGF